MLEFVTLKTMDKDGNDRNVSFAYSTYRKGEWLARHESIEYEVRLLGGLPHLTAFTRASLLEFARGLVLAFQEEDPLADRSPDG